MNCGPAFWAEFRDAVEELQTRISTEPSRERNISDANKLYAFSKRWDEFIAASDPLSLLKPFKKGLLPVPPVYVLKKGKWGAYFAIDFQQKILFSKWVVHDNRLDHMLSAAFGIGTKLP